MNRMQELRIERGITMKEAAQLLNMPYTTYVNYEKGTREPSSETLIAIANFYNTSIDYLLGKSNTRIDEATLDIVNGIDMDLLQQAGNIRDALRLQRQRDADVNSALSPAFEPLPQMVSLPLVGEIACGTPILAETNIEDYINVPAEWHADFVLRCKGNSMEPEIRDGDIVCIRRQSAVEEGEIAAILDGENCEAALKHFHRTGDVVMLTSDNPSYAPIVYTGEKINDLRIEGKAVGICRGLR